MDPNVAATPSASVSTSPTEKNDTEAQTRTSTSDAAGSRTDGTTKTTGSKNNKAKLEAIVSNEAVDSSSDNAALSPNDPAEGGEPVPMKKGFPFYAIIAALALSSLLTSLEATIVSTALPTVIASLGGAGLYVWIVNGYYLTQTAFQPLFGQIADIYGRRWPMIASTAFFTLGSGVSGGAYNIQMLIAGRLIQGIGASGITVLTEIIICDLLPLRERGKYLGIMLGLIGVGAALGPLFGGLIVEYSTWRWVFYLNLPVGGAALVILFAFLRVRSDKTADYLQRLKRFDWLGNVVFVLSVVSVLIALSWSGTEYPWSAYQVIVPLVLGFAGFISFIFYEASRYCSHPTMPMHLFANRTSATAFVVTFLHTLSGVSVMYFLPVYFQAVLGSTPARAGIQLLPTILFMIPGAILGGNLLSKFGRYRPLQHAGFAFMIVGFGLLTLLGTDSSTGEWVGYQLFGALGTGIALPVLLPAVQASLKEEDTALSTSTWSFIRTFGFVWGATIATAVFNNHFEELRSSITDSVISDGLAGGRAYERATKTFIDTLTNPVTKSQVLDVYVAALNRVWYVSLAFAAVGFVLVILQKEVPLRKELDTKFSIEEKPKRDQSQA